MKSFKELYFHLAGRLAYAIEGLDRVSQGPQGSPARSRGGVRLWARSNLIVLDPPKLLETPENTWAKQALEIHVEKRRRFPQKDSI